MNSNRPGRLALVILLCGILAPLEIPFPGTRAALAKPTAALNALTSLPQFERAAGHRTWSFPKDHGQHARFRLEWWYYTGIVRTADGRPFGYQVTFFRRGLNPAPERSGSAWRTGSLYLAQIAISDLSQNRFVHSARTGRDALGLSGAAPDRQEVWLTSWRADPLAVSRDGVHLEAQDTALGISLDLAAEKPPLLQGEDGLDRKGPNPGQASWYYSIPRMATTGTLRVGQERFPIKGTSWMDHEFGTNQLGDDQVGWDWFAIRLDSGADLMLYRLRAKDGHATPASGGTLLEPNGAITRIRIVDANPDGFSDARFYAQLAPTQWWTSPGTHARYPVGWEIEIPQLNLKLSVAPAATDQELRADTGLPFSYWEGAVWIHGERAGHLLRGEGYLELTGYAGDLRGTFR